MEFKPLYLPGEGTTVPELRKILAANTLTEMAALRGSGGLDYSPVFDSSPYFFNAVHLSALPAMIRSRQGVGNLRAMMFLFGFMLAAIILVITTIVLPALRWTRKQGAAKAPPVWRSCLLHCHWTGFHVRGDGDDAAVVHLPRPPHLLPGCRARRPDLFYRSRQSGFRQAAIELELAQPASRHCGVPAHRAVFFCRPAGCACLHRGRPLAACRHSASAGSALRLPPGILLPRRHAMDDRSEARKRIFPGCGH